MLLYFCLLGRGYVLLMLGLEVGEDAAKSFWDDHTEFLYSHMRTENAEEMIHVIWYIINASESRVCDEDFRLMKELYRHTTVIVCLNKVI